MLVFNKSNFFLKILFGIPGQNSFPILGFRGALNNTGSELKNEIRKNWSGICGKLVFQIKGVERKQPFPFQRYPAATLEPILIALI